MNKKLLGFSLLSFLVAAGVVGYGYLPEKTYYPSGVLKSVANKKLYKKHGAYKEYFENGQLKLEATYQNDVKVGPQTEMFEGGVTAKSSFSAGRRDGATEISYPDGKKMVLPFKNDKLVGDAKILDMGFHVKEDGTFLVKEELPFSLAGHVVCSDSEIIAASVEINEQKRLKSLLTCASIDQIKMTEIDSPVMLTFEGSFVYPKFVKTSTIDVSWGSELKEEVEEYSSELQQSMGIVNPDQMYGKIIFDENDRNVYIKTYTKDNKELSSIEFDFTSLSNLITNVSNFSDTFETAPLVAAVKNIFLTNMTAQTAHGKKYIDLVGKISVLGMEKDGFVSFYNHEEKTVAKITKTEKGFRIEQKYPYSGKEWFAFDIEMESKTLDMINSTLSQMTDFNPLELQMKFSSLSPTDLIPEAVLIKNFIVKDYDGNNVLTTNELTLKPREGYVGGEIIVYEGGQQKDIFKVDGETLLKKENDAFVAVDKNDFVSEEWLNKQHEKMLQPIEQEVVDIVSLEPEKTNPYLFGFTHGFISNYVEGVSSLVVDTSSLMRTVLDELLASGKKLDTDANELYNEVLKKYGQSISAKIEFNEFVENGFTVKITPNTAVLCKAIADGLSSECQDGVIIYHQEGPDYRSLLEPVGETVAKVQVEKTPEELLKYLNSFADVVAQNLQQHIQEKSSVDGFVPLSFNEVIKDVTQEDLGIVVASVGIQPDGFIVKTTFNDVNDYRCPAMPPLLTGKCAGGVFIYKKRIGENL